MIELLKLLHLISKQKYKEKKAIRTIKRSKLFDSKWYLEKYPDVKRSRMSAANHYYFYGWIEGRNPSEKFSTNAYLNSNPDVKKKGMNPLLHYIKFGSREGRSIVSLSPLISDYDLLKNSTLFDSKWYLEKNSDVAKNGIDPIIHYLNMGWKEGRLPSPLFDSDKYLSMYLDIKNNGINPLIHYLRYGQKENRKFCGILTADLENQYQQQIKNVIADMKSSLPKAVLISHELTHTGAPYALLKLAEILKNKGWEVFVISPSDSGLADSFKPLHIPCLIIPHLLDLNISFYAQAFKGLDFALCNTVILTKLASKLQNILPTLLYIHEGEEGIKSPVTQKYFMDRINDLRHICQVACVSPFARGFYTPYAKNISLIHNSVTVQSNFAPQKHKNLRFAYVGALTDTPKNVSLLVKSFRKLSKEYSDIELHLIGQDNTPLGKKLKKEKNIKNIIFHGVVTGKEKDKLCDEMDIFVIPSHTESCSLVALEAAAHSKAVILTENVGAKYMFKNGESALICKVDDEESLYECMKKLCKDKQLKDKIAKNSYKAYLKHATPETTEKDLLTAIKKTIDDFNQSKKINNLTIIIPVYNAAEKVDKCIQSIIKNTKLSEQIKLLIIDDCSPEESVKKMLNKYRQLRFVTIMRNSKNLGYTVNINKAIKLVKNRDVILLNSDTIVTRDWVKKIQKVAYMSPSIGTVTPVSNSAGAFSVPQSGVNIIPPFLDVEEMAKLVEDCGRNKFFDVPTGNGFCFFIKGQVIQEVGLFDEENFPRGYGEENDYSMRVKQHGFLNLVTLDTYIFHHEHASFKETSQQLMKKGGEILNQLYPQYRKEIQVFNSNVILNSTKQQISDSLKKRLIKKYEHSDIKFSVIMPTYNRAFCIRQAIDSLLAQSYQNFELIICDDGSSDNTEKLIKRAYKKEMKSKKIVYLKSNHKGVCAARNMAMKHATGDWIAYLDTDNVIDPDYLITYVSYISCYPDHGMFYAKMKVEGTNFEIGEAFDRQKLEKANFIDLGIFVHHRSYMEKYGLFDTNLKRLVDWDLVLRYTKDEQPYFINRALLTYRNNFNIERISSNIYVQPHYVKIYKKHGLFSNITVTTMITTYNHENYIRQAIDSALTQTGNFNHEILISDDASTDSTRQIIKEYAQKYPDIIKDISSDKNLGISKNMKKCFQKASGKYIAVLEGDDYWTDAKKLQKQVDFLEKNTDCSMVFSRVKIFNQNSKSSFLLNKHEGLPSKLQGEHFLKEMSLIVNFSCTLYRQKYLICLPEVLYKDRLSEIALAMYLEQKGKIGYISTPLSVYRQHENGVWTGASRIDQLKSGLKGRQAALAVCANKYKPELKKIIDEHYIQPLNKLGVNV